MSVQDCFSYDLDFDSPFNYLHKIDLLDEFKSKLNSDSNSESNLLLLEDTEMLYGIQEKRYYVFSILKEIFDKLPVMQNILYPVNRKVACLGYHNTYKSSHNNRFESGTTSTNRTRTLGIELTNDGQTPLFTNLATKDYNFRCNNIIMTEKTLRQTHQHYSWFRINCTEDDYAKSSSEYYKIIAKNEIERRTQLLANGAPKIIRIIKDELHFSIRKTF